MQTFAIVTSGGWAWPFPRIGCAPRAASLVAQTADGGPVVRRLAAEAGEEVKQERQPDTQQKGSPQRSEYGKVFFPVGEIAGHFAYRESRLAKAKHDSPRDDQEDAKKHQAAAQILHVAYCIAYPAKR